MKYITIFELTYVMDKPEMEEILYEREKARGNPTGNGDS